MWLPTFSDPSFKFGLNRGAILSNIAYVVPENSEWSDKLVIEFTNKTNVNIYEISRVQKGDTIITDRNHPEFRKKVSDVAAMLTQLVLCYVPFEILTEKTKALNAESTFAEFSKIMIKLIITSEKFAKKTPIAVRCCYKYTKAEAQTQADLIVAPNAKWGVVFSPDIDPTGSDEWTEVKTYRNPDADPNDRIVRSISYTDDAGNIHPIGFISGCPKEYMDARKRKDLLDDAGNPASAKDLPF